MSEGKRISLDVIVSDIIMFPQGFIQDFSKGGGELNDVHPLNLCSLMHGDSHRRPKPHRHTY